MEITTTGFTDNQANQKDNGTSGNKALNAIFEAPDNTFFNRPKNSD